MGKVIAVCISKVRGTPKENIHHVHLIEDYGIEGDAHAGKWHRQVSLLSYDRIQEFRKRGAKVDDGAFGENLVVEGIDFKTLPIGTKLKCGEVILEITQIGKECHNGCAIFKTMGDCIMPREGVFARVLCGGVIREGDEMEVVDTEAPDKEMLDDEVLDKEVLDKEVLDKEVLDKEAPDKEVVDTDTLKIIESKTIAPKMTMRCAIITSSDSGYEGRREDASGPLVAQMAKEAGYEVVLQKILPDDQAMLEETMKKICDEGKAELLLTTGGTGFSPRDVMPEATLAVSERMVPGIPEAMRAYSMQFTKRAMLSRAASGIRKKTLIVNLPGSPKAVKECLEYILPELRHGLEILQEITGNCARR